MLNNYYLISYLVSSNYSIILNLLTRLYSLPTTSYSIIIKICLILLLKGLTNLNISKVIIVLINILISRYYNRRSNYIRGTSR